ncbi:hypothetical protein [endosymbiont of Lamellibrachia barhami]|uniref:hypothetical protein n=1 Tax=endosymbiont of Lamellibrachia barhami TaxID=205975 RepID=UPI0015B243D0|nr:hypothetical protein [endosymbiont of Lamellibrachia barhami]
MNKEVTQHHQTFESLKHTQDGGVEFWTARELQSVLDYSRWEKFERVVKKAMAACKKSGQAIGDHFPQMVNMVMLATV